MVNAGRYRLVATWMAAALSLSVAAACGGGGASTSDAEPDGPGPHPSCEEVEDFLIAYAGAHGACVADSECVAAWAMSGGTCLSCFPQRPDGIYPAINVGARNEVVDDAIGLLAGCCEGVGWPPSSCPCIADVVWMYFVARCDSGRCIARVTDSGEYCHDPGPDADADADIGVDADADVDADGAEDAAGDDAPEPDDDGAGATEIDASPDADGRYASWADCGWSDGMAAGGCLCDGLGACDAVAGGVWEPLGSREIRVCARLDGSCDVAYFREVEGGGSAYRCTIPIAGACGFDEARDCEAVFTCNLLMGDCPPGVVPTSVIPCDLVFRP